MIRRWSTWFFCVGSAAAVWVQLATGDPRAQPIEDVVVAATSTGTAESQAALSRLRALGPAGLEQLVARYDFEIGALARALQAGVPPTPEQQRLRAALDTVARQRDAWSSRLYWYTDLGAAKAEAARTGRPILSLRLLGQLDQELSCANSRYFRTALYPDPAIAAHLRSNWVLHWESVRPAPKISIDFGDGRTLERTITGNSLHYALAADGQPLDALPGLESPKEFLAWIERMERFADSLRDRLPAERASALATFHRQRLDAIRRDWSQALGRAGTFTELEAITASKWGELAAAQPVRLDSASVAVMRSKTAGLYATDGFERTLNRFQAAIAEDTLRNEWQLHRQIHEWFAADAQIVDLGALTDRIYTEIFLTPNSDPWLGLSPPWTYSAIEGDGRTAVDGVAIPTDDAVTRKAPSTSAEVAGRRTVSKIALELPAIRSTVAASPASPVDPKAVAVTRAEPRAADVETAEDLFE